MLIVQLHLYFSYIFAQSGVNILSPLQLKITKICSISSILHSHVERFVLKDNICKLTRACRHLIGCWQLVSEVIKHKDEGF